jgi:spermidine/putrescine transport system substrate-binding protein
MRGVKSDGRRPKDVGLSRRALLAAGGGAAAAAMLPFRPARAQGGKVTILTWETYHDDEWVAAFTERTGIEVQVIRAGSVDEMYATTRSGAIKPDIVYFDTGSIPRYLAADLIEPVDPAQVENTQNILPSLDWKTFNTFNGGVFGVPYMWGTQPLMYDAGAMEKPASWAAMWDEANAGKVSTFDDAYVNMPMVGLYSKVANPYSFTDADWETVTDALRRLRPQMRTMSRGYDDMVNIFMSGDASIAYCQNISIAHILRERGKEVYVTYPDEGTPAWVDNAVITKGSGRPEVYAFISEGLSLAWQARMIGAHGGNGVISEADALANGTPEDVLKLTEVASANDPAFWSKMSVLQTPEDFDRRLQLWNDFKAGVL